MKDIKQVIEELKNRKPFPGIAYTAVQERGIFLTADELEAIISGVEKQEKELEGLLQILKDNGLAFTASPLAPPKENINENE